MDDGRPPPTPWNICKKDDDRRPAHKPYDFPALGAKGLSKSAARKRAVYAAAPGTSRFDAYPPRQDVLARIYLEQEGLYDAQDDDVHVVNQEDWDDSQTEPVQRANGMSSVIINDGQRMNGGPDIYSSRRRLGLIKNGKGKQKEDVVTNESPSPQDSPRPAMEKPEPMTQERIDDLLMQRKRIRQLRAAEERHTGLTSSSANLLDEEDPLQDEIRKAFSSIDGFLAAFSERG